MTQTAIADFMRRFRHIVFPRFQQFRRPLHPQLPQIMRDGLTSLGGKDAAQIKVTAPDLFAEFFQGRWRGEILLEQKDDLLHAILCDALLPGAE
jgi:hypothetical protein